MNNRYYLKKIFFFLEYIYIEDNIDVLVRKEYIPVKQRDDINGEAYIKIVRKRKRAMRGREREREKNARRKVEREQRIEKGTVTASNKRLSQTMQLNIQKK